MKLDKKEYECFGGEVLMSLNRKAFESVCDVDLNKEDGVKKMLNELDKR